METKKTIEKIKHNEHNIRAKAQHEITQKMEAVEHHHNHHHHKHQHGEHQDHHEHE